MEDIIKKFTFSKEEKEKLENIQIGLINAEATLDGLHIYKEVFLEGVYKRLGINKEIKGYKSHIQYNLGTGEITYTETKTNGKN